MLPSFLKLNKFERGSAGIMALLVMIVLLIVGGGLMTRSTTESKISSNYTDGVSAQYLAESGVKHAQAWIIANGYPTKPSMQLQQTIEGVGTYKMTIKGDEDTFSYTVTSIGETNHATRQVVATLVKKEDVYDYVAYGGAEGGEIRNHGVSIYPSVSITGNVGSSKCIAVKDYSLDWVTGFTKIAGNLEAGGTVDSNGLDKTIVAGMIREHATMGKKLPEVSYTTTGKSDLAAIKSDSRFSLKGKDYYSKGLTLGENDEIIGPGTIVVKGDIFLENGASITGNPVLLMATGDIYVGTGIGYPDLITVIRPARVDKAVLISNGNIFINNMGNSNTSLANWLVSLITGKYPMIGSAIAKGKVTLYGASKITYDETMIEEFRNSGKLPKRLFIKSWNSHLL